jgi:hypothetical protein
MSGENTNGGAGGHAGPRGRTQYAAPLSETLLNGQGQVDRQELARRMEADRVLIAELRAEGLLDRAHAEHLEEALRSSRRIGAAVGIVMSRRNLSEDDAFELLRRASMNGNRKLRSVADEVVLTGDVSDLDA